MAVLFIEIDATIAAGEDFTIGMRANPYPKQSPSWRHYENEYNQLAINAKKAKEVEKQSLNTSKLAQVKV